MTLIRKSPSGPEVDVSSGGGFPLLALAVNTAGVDIYPDGSKAVLRTGSTANPAGAFNGGGIGNKAILGLIGRDMPASALSSIEYQWTSELGPTGPIYNPPGPASVTLPYCNMLVDFGGGDIRILVILDSGAAPGLGIGTFTNPGGLNLIHNFWDSTMNVLMVNSPPNPVPGGVAPAVSLGPSWPANSYSWAALMAANPLAKLVTAFPANPAFFPLGDGGMPVGATIPSLVIVSGDSTNVVKSGKTLRSVKVNGIAVPL